MRIATWMGCCRAIAALVVLVALSPRTCPAQTVGEWIDRLASDDPRVSEPAAFSFGNANWADDTQTRAIVAGLSHRSPYVRRCVATAPGRARTGPETCGPSADRRLVRQGRPRAQTRPGRLGQDRRARGALTWPSSWVPVRSLTRLESARTIRPRSLRRTTPATH